MCVDSQPLHATVAGIFTQTRSSSISILPLSISFGHIHTETPCVFILSLWRCPSAPVCVCYTQVRLPVISNGKLSVVFVLPSCLVFSFLFFFVSFNSPSSCSLFVSHVSHWVRRLIDDQRLLSRYASKDWRLGEIQGGSDSPQMNWADTPSVVKICLLVAVPLSCKSVTLDMIA